MRAPTLLLLSTTAALAHPIPALPTTTCSPVFELISSAGQVLGVDLAHVLGCTPHPAPIVAAQPETAGGPRYPESVYDDMDDPADYGEWPVLPDFHTYAQAEGGPQ